MNFRSILDRTHKRVTNTPNASDHVSASCLLQDKSVHAAKQTRFFDLTQARTEMVGHLVHVGRAAPLALENVPMGRLGPWLDLVTQLALSSVSALVLVAAVGLSAVARNKIYADNTTKTGT